MRQQIRLLVVLTLGLSGITPSAAAPIAETRPTPEQIFESDATLGASTVTIVQMKRPELDTFVNYLTQCSNPFAANDVVRQACEVARDHYLIEFDADRPLDREIKAVELIGLLMKTNDAIHKRTPSATILRYSHVTGALRDAANERYKALRAGH